MLLAIDMVTFGSFLLLTGESSFYFLFATFLVSTGIVTFYADNLLLPTLGVAALTLTPAAFLAGEVSDEGTILF